jgi:4-amino-4-deoxy-L-arabinose transferase-like glycosyltransferase
MPEPFDSDAAPRNLREAWREPEFRFLALATLVAFFARLWEGTLDGDPVLYASVAKGIAQSGDWLDLRVGDVAYWNKPPLMFWLTAVLFRLFGISTFVACFWSATFGAASVLALHRLAREVFDRPIALYAATAMLLTPELLRYASRFRLESVSVFFMILALHDGWRAVQRNDARPLARVGLWVGLLFLAKGGPGFIALLAVGVFAAWSRAGRLVVSPAALRGLAWLLGLGLSWPLVQWLRHGDPWIAQAIGVELLQLDTVGLPGQNPLTFYPARLLRTNSLWLALGLLGLRSLWRDRAARPDAWRLLVSWLGVAFLLISLPERLFGRYLTAVHPALALLSGVWLGRALAPERFAQLSRWLPRLAITAALVLLCLPVPVHEDEARLSRELDAALSALAPGIREIPVYREVNGLARAEFYFHLDRPLRIYEDRAALAAGAFPLIVTDDDLVKELEADGWRLHLIGGWRWRALLAPQPQAGARTTDSRRLQ